MADAKGRGTKKRDENVETEGVLVDGKLQYIVPAVDRAVKILLLLKREGREMTIAEIADATGWPRSSIHKILLTLNYHALLDRDVRTKRYSLGSEFTDMGQFTIAAGVQRLRSVSRPFLEQLVKYSNESASVSVLRNTQIIFLDGVEAPVPNRVSVIIGVSMPATVTASGRAVLAFLPSARVDEIVRSVGLPSTSGKSIVSIRDYYNELDIVRKRGYAIDGEEWRTGMVGVAAPVFNPRKQAVGAVSIVGEPARMPMDKLDRYGKKCVKVSEEITRQLR
ncbi:MAG: IclR family transcriptional regulator [Acidobacteriota bacterium]|nr:IclR family transcriptional regulator [Acidobacteriota bacterium]